MLFSEFICVAFMHFTFAFCLSFPPTQQGNWATSIDSWPWHNKLWTFLMLYTRSTRHTGHMTYCIGSWRGMVWRSAGAPTPRSRSRRRLWTRIPSPPLSRASHRHRSRKQVALAILAVANTGLTSFCSFYHFLPENYLLHTHYQSLLIVYFCHRRATGNKCLA